MASEATCPDCGRKKEAAFRVRCDACHDAAMFAKARKAQAADWALPVFGHGEDDEHYWCRTDEAAEFYDDPDRAGAQRPLWVWGAKTIPFAFDAGGLVDRMLEGYLADQDDVDDVVSAAAVAELQALLDAWVAKHRPTYYEPDYSVAVLL